MPVFSRHLVRMLHVMVAALICVGLTSWPVGVDAAQKKKQPSTAQSAKKAKQIAKATPKRHAKAVTPSRDAKHFADRRKSSKIVKATGARRTLKAVGGPAAATVDRQAVRSSMGAQMGLRQQGDPLDLSASVALVLDQETKEVLFSKNESAVLPIASITKLMTGLVVADAQLAMSDAITITQDDVDTYKGSSSRLAVGTTLSREELMHLALMSSENRAAHALGRTFPGGMARFVELMNQKAVALGMHDTRFVEPTGLSSANRSSARDLATLAAAAYERPILRELSTSPSHYLDTGRRVLRYNNSNKLIHSPDWQIGLQKTGYISEAGRCLVMQAQIAGRKLIMVLLDSAGKASRLDDAERMRKWVEATTLMQWPERPRR